MKRPDVYKITNMVSDILPNLPEPRIKHIVNSIYNDLRGREIYDLKLSKSEPVINDVEQYHYVIKVDRITIHVTGNQG